MSKSDRIANLVILALGLYVTYHSYDSLKLGILISPGAGFLPFLCGIALIGLGLVWRLQTILAQFRARGPKNEASRTAACEEEPAPLPGSRLKLCLAFVTTVAYAALFERIGFFAATVIFMLAWEVVVERQRWRKAAVITVLCAAAMYTLFKLLLHVELPSNPWFM